MMTLLLFNNLNAVTQVTLIEGLLLNFMGMAAVITCVIGVVSFLAYSPMLGGVKKKGVITDLFQTVLPGLMLGLLITAGGCKEKISVGVKKDFNTGLTASYKNMEPEKTMLVMNDEVLGHADIHIGEKFYIVNDKITGLVEKDGKVSVGCSLLIADKKGTEIMNEADLFKGNDVFAINDFTYLRCGVNTGSPMEYEEKYDVKVVFGDKYGTANIDNKVTIRMIDVP